MDTTPHPKPSTQTQTQTPTQPPTPPTPPKTPKKTTISSQTKYEYERYKTTTDNLKKTLEKYGVAIIPNVINQEECDNMTSGMWDYIEHITKRFTIPIKRDNPASWKEFRKLYPLHSMLLQRYGIGQAQYIWDLRQNRKITSIFAKLWNCDDNDLLVSFDGASIHFPPEKTKSNSGWFQCNNWLHTDQSYTKTNFECVQSWITGFDVNEGDATLTFLEGSHKYHGEFATQFKVEDKTDWYKLENDEQYKFYMETKNCPRKSIKCPVGSMVFWDSRTIHMGQEPLSTREKDNFRNVAYLCYVPRHFATKANLAKKIKAFEELRTTSHYPHKGKLFPVNPRTYGSDLPDVEPILKPTINDLGRRLVGYE